MHIGDASLKDRENFISEIDLLKTVSLEGHTHVVRMVGCVTMATPMMLVLEHITCGNLHEWLKAKNTKVQFTVLYLYILQPVAFIQSAYKHIFYTVKMSSKHV